MSVESLAACLPVTGISPTAKLVLLGIANHDGDGGAWPSVATLAGYAMCSTRTVQRCLRELETAGMITTIRQGGGLRDQPAHARPNRFLVHPPVIHRGDIAVSPGG